MLIDVFIWTIIIYGILLILGKTWSTIIAFLIKKFLKIKDYLYDKIVKNRIAKSKS